MCICRDLDRCSLLDCTAIPRSNCGMTEAGVYLLQDLCERNGMLKDIGAPELLIILVIVLLIFGAGKLPQIGAAMGKSIREFKKAKDGADEPVPQKVVATSVASEEKEKR